VDDDFELLDAPGAAAVRLRFQGTLRGEPVRWDATFMTLARAGAPRSFIEVGDAAELRSLTVALPVAAMDLPAIRKTVVMVRNWKRLAPGRHEFG
jgi:hypothetical protein